MTEQERKENLLMEALDGLVRVGTVTDRRMEERRVRVLFSDTGYTSGWLPVLINRDIIGSDVTEYDETQWTEFETEWKGTRTGDPDYADHRHKLAVKPWMPRIGDEVLTVYLPVFNADGFVVGGIKRWR